MIFITGDMHGSYDIHKFSANCFKEQKELTRSDYAIICGDFGLLWDKNSKENAYWLKWLNKKPWTTLWIDGNHENFDMLKEYPVQDWKGGKVQKITDNIIHLCRGSIFNINNTKIFAFGGAESHDKQYHKMGISMWEEEMPGEEEMETGRKNLDAAGWNVDIIVTHSFPSYIQNQMFGNMNYNENALTEYFDEIDKRVNYKFWFSGHYHVSQKYNDSHYAIYNDIVKITDNDFESVFAN